MESIILMANQQKPKEAKEAEIPKPKPKSTKPRGRPPRGMEWDEKSEKWLFVEEEEEEE